MQRRQALAGATSSVNKVAQSVTQTIAGAGPAREVSARDDSGGTWVRDGAPAGRVMGKERSKRRRLLNAARASLERAQARVAETGEDLKKKSHRGAIEASGKIARGVRKLLPQSGTGESITGYQVMENTRRLADFTACQAEVARIRDLRCAQQQAGRYDGRQPRVPNVTQPASADTQADSPPQRGPRARVNALHARVAEEASAAAACEILRTVPDEPEALRGRDEATDDEARSSSSSLTFDLVSDEELLFAYQTALDELEIGEKSEDSDETDIIALAVSGMQVHVDLLPFAITRLYELVGLQVDSMTPEAAGEDLGQVVVAEGAHNSRQATCGRGESEENTAEEYISANSLCPALARGIAGLPQAPHNQVA